MISDMIYDIRIPSPTPLRIPPRMPLPTPLRIPLRIHLYEYLTQQHRRRSAGLRGARLLGQTFCEHLCKYLINIKYDVS